MFYSLETKKLYFTSRFYAKNEYAFSYLYRILGFEGMASRMVPVYDIVTKLYGNDVY